MLLAKPLVPANRGDDDLLAGLTNQMEWVEEQPVENGGIGLLGMAPPKICERAWAIWDFS